MNKPAKETVIEVRTAAHRSLDWLNTELREVERTSGPLIGMMLDNDKSLFRFDGDENRPTKKLHITKHVAGKPQVPEGATLITSGRIFIEGDQVLCAASRGPEATGP